MARYRVRVGRGAVKLYPDWAKILGRFQAAGICDSTGRPIPRFYLFALNHRDIIVRYNSILRGVRNYYSFVDSGGAFQAKLEYILLYSCAKLLAAKFKLGTVAAVVKAYGPLLKDPVRGVGLDLRRQRSTSRMAFKVGASDRLDLLYVKRRTNSRLLGPCIICGCPEVEIHHVRHVRKMTTGLRPYVKDMSLLNRKQVPLCAGCHKMVHRGKYDGPRLGGQSRKGLEG